MKKKLFQFFNMLLEAVLNEAKPDAPCEVTIYDQIGKDPWDGKGMSAEDFRNALAEVCPARDRDLHIFLNSKGGDVHEGLAIRNELEAWPKNVTGTITGVAASTASWILPAKAKVRAYKNSQVFIHDAVGFVGGPEEKVRTYADQLGVVSNQIAAMYADRNGKSIQEMRTMMKATRLMTGQDAKDLGLIDEIIDGTAVRNFSPAELGEMKNRIAAIYNSASQGGPRPNDQHKEQIMNREQIIALLTEHGVTVANNATDEQLQAALKQLLNSKKNSAENKTVVVDDTKIIDLQNQIKALSEANAEARRTRIANEVDKLIANDQVTGKERDAAIKRAVADESYLNELRERPSIRPGAEPIGHSTLESASDDVRNVMKAMQNHIIIGAGQGDKMVTTATQRSVQIANIYQRERDKVLAFMNATTINIDAGLKRQVILNETVRAFARRAFSLSMLATVYSNVPLQGTDKIEVPYFPLQIGASKDWDGNAGYVFDGTVNQQVKEITVNKRKYQALDYGSDVFRRQPFFNAMTLGNMNAEKLALDALVDILSVVTAANFGAAVKTGAAAAMTSDDVIDIQGACNDAHWPDGGRGLLVDSSVNTGLQKDSAYKLALNVGGTEVIRSGRLPNVSGFNYDWMPNLPDNAEKLIGFAAFMSAILAAFCPVDPAPGVRSQLTAYEVVTDPITGISMNYRSWGQAQPDRDYQVIETAYGYAAGEAAALKRICKP